MKRNGGAQLEKYIFMEHATRYLAFPKETSNGQMDKQLKQ